MILRIIRGSEILATYTDVEHVDIMNYGDKEYTTFIVYLKTDQGGIKP